MNVDPTRLTLRQVAAKLEAETIQLRADSKTLDARGFRALAGDVREIASRLETVAAWCRS